MCWRVMVRAVIVVQRLRLLHLSDPNIFLQLFLHLLLLHVVLKLLMKTVQSMNEFVIARMCRSSLWTQMWLVHELLLLLLPIHVLIVLIREIVVIFLTADRVIVGGVDLNILQTLTAQRQLMMHEVLRTLQREVWRRRWLIFGMKIVLESIVVVAVVMPQSRTSHVAIIGQCFEGSQWRCRWRRCLYYESVCWAERRRRWLHRVASFRHLIVGI